MDAARRFCPGCPRAEALSPQGWPGAVEAAPEAGVGGLGVPGSGPRPQPARSAVLPRLSAMLIFGLCRPCPGISRHASRRPVCRPEPGGRRDRTAVAPLPRSARWTLPRPIALCLGLCLAAVAATTPRGESPPRPIPPSNPPSQLGTRMCPHPHPRPGSARAAPQPRASSPGRRSRADPRDAPHQRGTAQNEVRRKSSYPAALTPYPSPPRT